jgi:hypothetical protein
MNTKLEALFSERRRLERREAELESLPFGAEARAVAARLSEVQALLDADERARRDDPYLMAERREAALPIAA